jgi:hypothetical protein
LCAARWLLSRMSLLRPADGPGTPGQSLDLAGAASRPVSVVNPDAGRHDGGGPRPVRDLCSPPTSAVTTPGRYARRLAPAGMCS